MRRILACALIALAPLATPGAAAATTLRSASVVEGETFEFSPFSVEVRFSEPVQLVNARLVDQEGREAPLDLSAYRQRADSFVIELPVLPPHGYRLSWRVRPSAKGDQQGSVGFTVKGCVDPRAVAAKSTAR